MKIAISAMSDDLNQQVNPVFGRCPGYIITEVEEKKVKSHSFLPNQAMNATGGAGIVAAQSVAAQQVQAVITGNVGPNAFAVLQSSGIKVYQAFGLTIQQAIQQFIEGKLPELGSSSVGPFFGAGPGAGRGLGRGMGRGAGRGAGGGFGRGAGIGSPI